MRLNSILILIFVGGLSAYAQPANPQPGDYQFPIRPKQENYLSGTVGELRRTHFHTGLDIKTSGITGLPVFAAADGYVQRIRVSTSGYGNALYVVHPHNKTITVYAHLKSFDPEIAAFVREQQYKEKTFEINLFPKENQFLFKKNDIIAKSGNSGSSSGPHLHFEVRTDKHRVLDPLKYGFDEIDDTTAPILEKIAFVTMDENSRINGAFGRFEFDVIENSKGEMVLDNSVFLQGKIGVEVYAYDRFDRARNKNGILIQSLMLDNKPVFDQSIDYLEFSMARSILIHTNYARSVSGGRRFNKYYVDDGNTLNFYQTEQSGFLNINDPMPHNIGIRLADSYDNIIQYNFNINGDGELNLENKIWDNIERDGFEISDNYLEFKADLSDFGYCEAFVYKDSIPSRVQLAYDQGDVGFYIWDLRNGLPDSIRVCNDSYAFDFVKMINSNREQKWKTDDIVVNFPKKCLFDTAYLRYSRDTSSANVVHRFSNFYTPLKKNITITMTPSKMFDQEKTFVYAVDRNNRLSYVGGKWQEDQLVFKTRDFGNYTLATDSIPPVVSALKTKIGKVKFRIKDEMSGIKKYEAQLNGEWFLMNYDAKYNVIWSDEMSRVEGDFKLTVWDNCDNGTVFEKKY